VILLELAHAAEDAFSRELPMLQLRCVPARRPDDAAVDQAFRPGAPASAFFGVTSNTQLSYPHRMTAEGVGKTQLSFPRKAGTRFHANE
jgi:hypothetical protein